MNTFEFRAAVGRGFVGRRFVGSGFVGRPLVGPFMGRRLVGLIAGLGVALLGACSADKDAPSGQWVGSPPIVGNASPSGAVATSLGPEASVPVAAAAPVELPPANVDMDAVFDGFLEPPSASEAAALMQNAQLETRPRWPADAEGNPVRATRALPTSAGSLTVSQDGRWAFAADPDRSQAYIVDLDDRSFKTLPVEVNVELGRSVSDGAARFFALGRGSGEVLSIDAAAGSITARASVCAAPRGIAYLADQGQLWIACRSGLLVTLDATTLERTQERRLSVDLRDIVPFGSGFAVTRFRSAEILVLDANGELLSRAFAPDTPCATANSLYRVVTANDGAMLFLYQRSVTAVAGTVVGSYYSGCQSSGVTPIAGRGIWHPTEEVPAEQAPAEQAPAEQAPAEQAPAEQVVSAAPGDLELTSATLGINPAGAMDLALSPDGSRLGFLFAANAFRDPERQPTVSVLEGTLESAFVSTDLFGGVSVKLPYRGEPVALAFDANNQTLVFSREPAALYFEDGTILSLSSESQADTGHAMFHTALGTGLSCSSCHPEGEEDGHAWSFVQGTRRTQMLRGGVLSRRPFHWDGELQDFDALVDEEMSVRMGLRLKVPADYKQALAQWLDALPAVAHADVADEDAVIRGQQLFADATLACVTCHAGAAFADNSAYDVGTGGVYQTPTLLGIGLRERLMHDGCASDLTSRFGACGGGDAHGITSGLTPEQLSDLVAYLETL